ncbi:MAG: CdaR family protein [Anaerolineales bacterium]|jgi:YbbR domain-containing protein
MLRSVGTNLRTLLLAFILAVAVWVSAVTSADPDETRVFPNLVPIQFVDQDPGLITTGQVPQKVQVTLRAPRSVWDKMTSDPTSVQAVADLTGLGPGTHSVSVQLQVTARPVRIISVAPDILELSLEPLITRTLPVELVLTGQTAIGYQTGAPVLNPPQVVISGPESLVAQVAHIRLTLDVSNARQSIATTLPVAVLNQQGAVLNSITTHPGSIAIRLPLTQQGGYRDLAVKVVTSGTPASGYRLTNVIPFPPIVTVFSSNTSLIQSMPGYVETAPLDLSGAQQDIITNLSLNLPAGVALVGEDTVQVQVGVAPIEGSLTMSYRPVEIIGLVPGLEAHLSPQTVDVILSGPLPVLDALLASDVHVQVDLSRLPIGIYQLTPTVKISNQQVAVESILPGTVEVIIAPPVTPTP